jgi:AcrR family transcriptional regulator
VRRDERLLEVATRLFMENGFDATSIDAVAEEAGVGKPTLYARYRDKGELFGAVLRARIDEWIAPISEAAEREQEVVDAADLAAVFDDLSRSILRNASKPQAAALRRAIAAQALRFPELARFAYERGWSRAVESVGRLLASAQDKGLIIGDPDIAADLFLSLLMGPSSRAALYGIEIDPEGLERQRKAAVDLFLRGVTSAAVRPDLV